LRGFFEPTLFFIEVHPLESDQSQWTFATNRRGFFSSRIDISLEHHFAVNGTISVTLGELAVGRNIALDGPASATLTAMPARACGTSTSAVG
jgi:hypothetical protein